MAVSIRHKLYVLLFFAAQIWSDSCFASFESWDSSDEEVSTPVSPTDSSELLDLINPVRPICFEVIVDPEAFKYHGWEISDITALFVQSEPPKTSSYGISIFQLLDIDRILKQYKAENEVADNNLEYHTSCLRLQQITIDSAQLKAKKILQFLSVKNSTLYITVILCLRFKLAGRYRALLRDRRGDWTKRQFVQDVHYLEYGVLIPGDALPLYLNPAEENVAIHITSIDGLGFDFKLATRQTPPASLLPVNPQHIVHGIQPAGLFK